MTTTPDHNISKGDADIEIQKFIAIRNELRKPEILALLSPEAVNYVNSQYVSFTFDSAQIQAKLEYVKANGYSINLAAKSDGIPTIVIYPSKIDDNNNITFMMGAPGREGDQWPFAMNSNYIESKGGNDEK